VSRARETSTASGGFIQLWSGETPTLSLVEDIAGAEQTPTSEQGSNPFSASSKGSTEVEFRGEMPSLRELLEANAVAYAILEIGKEEDQVTEDRADSTRYRQARERVWASLLLIGFLWGVVSTASLLSPDFIIKPATALLGLLGLAVLALTLLAHAKENS